jgi:hypothetical protein
MPLILTFVIIFSLPTLASAKLNDSIIVITTSIHKTISRTAFLPVGFALRI